MTFSVSIFASILSSIFIENGSQNGPADRWDLLLFGSLFATFSRSWILCWFYVELGSLLAPFWVPLAPFWLTFGALRLTFGALGLTFGAPVARCSHFWCLLASFLIFVYIFEENHTQNHIFRKLLLWIRLLLNQTAISQRMSHALLSFVPKIIFFQKL